MRDSILVERACTPHARTRARLHPNTPARKRAPTRSHQDDPRCIRVPCQEETSSSESGEEEEMSLDADFAHPHVH